MLTDLTGKTAVVTGSTSGIGRAIADSLIARGANVMFSGVYFDDAATAPEPRLTAAQKGAAFKAEIDALQARLPAGQKLDFYACDVTNRTQVSKLLRDAADMGSGTVDIVVNNAGIHPPSVQKPFASVSPEAFTTLMNVNFGGVQNVSHAALPYLPKAGGGSIINISSVHGHVGSPDRAAYCSAKHAVEGFTKVVGAELAQAGHKMISIAPAFVKTELALAPLKERATKLSAERTIPYEQAFALAQEWRLQHQGGKWIELSDIATLCSDIASGKDTTQSGNPIKLDNGYTERTENGVVTFPPFDSWVQNKLPKPVVSDAITTERAAPTADKSIG